MLTITERAFINVSANAKLRDNNKPENQIVKTRKITQEHAS